MDLELSGKVFIVSGSTKGIGLGIARSLLDEGARVVITGRNQTALETATAELEVDHGDQVAGVAGDLLLDETLQAVLQQSEKRWGSIDGVVANAGSLRSLSADNGVEDRFYWYWKHNFLLTVRFVEYFLPAMRARGGSALVIGSIAGLEGLGAPAEYASAKGALNLYVKSLSQRVARDGVRVNMIAPGNILFPGGNWARKLDDDRSAVERMLDENVPLGRFGGPQEIGDLAAFLLSPRASFVTGACVVADGGQLKR